GRASWRATGRQGRDGDRVAGLAIVHRDLGMRMFVFEIFGSPDRNGLIIAVRAWLAVNSDLIARASHPPHCSSRSRRTTGGLVFALSPRRTRRAIASREAVKIAALSLPLAISASRVPPTSRARPLSLP